MVNSAECMNLNIRLDDRPKFRVLNSLNADAVAVSAACLRLELPCSIITIITDIKDSTGFTFVGSTSKTQQ